MSEAAVAPGAARAPRFREVINRKLGILFAVAALRGVANYMLAPFLTLYFHLVLGFSLPLSGVLVGLAFFSGMALGVVGGFLADRFGAVRAFVVAQVASGVFIAALGFVHAHQLLAAAVLMVLWGAVRPVGGNTMSALANQHAAPEHRGTVQTYMYWIQNAGVLVGLLVGAEALGAGASSLPIFLVAAVFAVMTIPIYLTFRTESEDHANRDDTDRGFRASMRLMTRDRAILMAAVTMLAAIAVEAQLDSSVPLFLSEHFINGTKLFGPILAVDALVVVVGQPILSPLIARFKPTWVYLVGALLSGSGLAFAGLDDKVAVWFIGMFFYAAGEVLWATQLNQLMGELPLAGREALTFSVVGMAQYCGMFLGQSLGPTVLAVHPSMVWFALPFVAVGGSWAFTDATAALKRRAAATQTVEVRQAGFEAAAAEQAESLAAVPSFQGAGAMLPIARVSEVAIFGIQMKSTPIVFLEAAAPEEREQIWDFGTTETMAAGDTLVTAGSTARTLYLLVDGELEVLVGSEGRERRLTLMTEGSIFGEQAFVDGQARSASIRATRACTVRALTWESFESLSAEHPQLAQLFLHDVARVVSERLRRTTEALTALSA